MKNRPYNVNERAEHLSKVAENAWHSLAELHNQTEVLSEDKKKLIKMMDEIFAMKEKFNSWKK